MPHGSAATASGKAPRSEENLRVAVFSGLGGSSGKTQQPRQERAEASQAQGPRPPSPREEEMEEGATPQPRRVWTTPLALTPFLRKSRWDGRLLCSGDIWAGQAREVAEARR